MDNVMRVNFEVVTSTSDGDPIRGTERKVAVLYNRTVISGEEVRSLIESGAYRYDERIVVTTQRSADALKGMKG